MKASTIITIAVCLAMGCGSVHAQTPRRGGVGLVLSGGGSKGIAHIGFIKALEDNDIPIDYITGTSMGAIVGGLYASGYSTEEMIQLIASRDFGFWSKGKVNPADTYYFLTQRTNPSFFELNLGKDSTQITSVLPISLINPIPMNYAFLQLFAPYTAQCGGDFDRLFVPFRCVTSDVAQKHKVVLGSGSLADAVRMSMSFPMVFEPLLRDGLPMYDGGIYDNYPVDVMMEDFHPSHIIGVNVASGKTPPDSRNPLDQLELLVMQPNNYPFPDSIGINIRIDLEQFGLLTFDKYAPIYEIGYKRGLEMIDSIKARIPERRPLAELRKMRSAFKAATPHVEIANVEVTGGSPRQNEFLKSFFTNEGLPMSLEQGKRAYYGVVGQGNIQNFVPYPTLNPSDSTIDIKFKAVLKDPFTVGLGGYISSSTNSMLFFNTGYNSLSYRSIRTNLNAWVGQSYLAAEGDFSLMLNSQRPTVFNVRLVASRQKYYETEKLFYQIHEPDFIRKSEAFARVSFSTAPTRRTAITAAVGYGHLTDRYFTDLRSTSSLDSHDKGLWDLGELRLRWARNSFDTPFAPSRGSEFVVSGTGVLGRYRYRGEEPYSRDMRWLELYAKAAGFLPVCRHFSIGGDFAALLTTRKLLHDYTSSIVAAPAFHPTPSSYNHFIPSLSANSYMVAGAVPVLSLSSRFQVRGMAYCFLPLRKIEYETHGDGVRYGKWLRDPAFFGELQALVNLPFGTISAYGNYTTSPRGAWNFGISFGAFILAPRFLGHQ